MIKKMLVLAAVFVAMNQHVEGTPLWESIKSYFAKKTEVIPIIRIMIAKDKPQVNIAVEGKFRIFDPRTNDHLATRQLGRKADVQSIGSGLHWAEGFPGVHQLMIVPADPRATITVDGKEYSGSIIVYEVEGNVTVINSIGFEELVASVLDNEVSEKNSLELLSASAIIARTNAYALAEKPANPFWAVSAEDLNYEGVPQNKDLSLIQKAVRNTRHMVLSGKDSAAISMDFAKNTGAKLLSVGKIPSKISFAEAKKLSEGGKDAAGILLYAFPDAHISMMQRN